MLPALLSAALCLLAPAWASEHTVTDEVWFDIEVRDQDGPGPKYLGRFTVGLMGETAPMTVLNFVKLVKGFKKGQSKSELGYKKSYIHRIVQDFVIQMGDITVGDGTGGESIYGTRFNDENFILSHQGPGWVAMANHGPDTNGSQFYIMLTKARWMDGKHVVFGKVVRGMDVVRKIGDIESDKKTAVPKYKVQVIDCGVNDLDAKYELTGDQLTNEADI